MESSCSCLIFPLEPYAFCERLCKQVALKVKAAPARPAIKFAAAIAVTYAAYKCQAENAEI